MPTSDDAKSEIPSLGVGVSAGTCSRGISISEKQQNQAIHRQLFPNITDIEAILSDDLSQREEEQAMLIQVQKLPLS